MSESTAIDLGKEFVARKIVLLPNTTELPRNLILDNWLKSYRNSGFARPIRTDNYNTGQRSLIHHAIDLGHIVVAAFAEEPTTIIGWLCVEDLTLHYVYV